MAEDGGKPTTTPTSSEQEVLHHDPSRSSWCRSPQTERTHHLLHAWLLQRRVSSTMDNPAIIRYG
jgi:hypothetical protein